LAGSSSAGSGVYPVGSLLPALSVAIGTAIVVVFALYVAWRWRFIGSWHLI
jgi:hypothetical protein